MSAPALLTHLKGNKEGITAIVFNNNLQFAAASTDKTIAVYSLKKKNERSMKFEMNFPIHDFDWNHKNIFAAVGCSKTINVCEAVMQKGYTEQIVAHQGNIKSVHFSNSGNRIITGSNDKIIKMWRLSHRNFISSFTGHTNWVRCVRFSPNNKMIASCSDDKTLKIFDVENGNMIHSFKDEKAHGNQVAWHKDNNTIAVANENGRVKIYDIKQRKLIQYYRIYSSAVKSLDFHPSGYYMITGDGSGHTKVLDLLEGRDIYTISGHQDTVTAVKFSLDGEYFVTGSLDKHLMVFKSNIVSNGVDVNDEQSFDEMSKQMNGKENESEAELIDTRKSVNYNYLSNDDVVEV